MVDPPKHLQDSEATVLGFRIWGTPWQPRFLDWAFNLDEPELAEKWKLIPAGIDILLLHGPPCRAGDWTIDCRSIGSPSLRMRIEELKPRLVVCGHNHAGYGQYTIGETPTGRCVPRSWWTSFLEPKSGKNITIRAVRLTVAAVE